MSTDLHLGANQLVLQEHLGSNQNAVQDLDPFLAECKILSLSTLFPSPLDCNRKLSCSPFPI
jgi:hypothetical protein